MALERLTKPFAHEIELPAPSRNVVAGEGRATLLAPRKMHSNSSLARPLRARNRTIGVSSVFCAAISLALFFAPSVSASTTPSGHINHVVIFWLKRPGHADDRARLVRASEGFRRMPGLLRVEVGRAQPVRRPGIEQAFDLCVVFTFRDQAALDRFEADPRHRRAVQTVLNPLVRRYAVFNSVAD